MLWMILIPLVAAPAAPWLVRRLGRHVGPLLALVPIGVGLALAIHLPMEPGTWRLEVLPWVPELGIHLAFRLDGLSITFGLLISGIGALVLTYAGGYMGDDPRLGRLCGLLLMFLAAMLGVVFSDDLFVLFVFWELTSIASWLLIGFKHEQAEARDSARMALLVTGAGGLALLAGLVLLTAAAAGSGIPLDRATRISALAGVGLSGHPLFTPSLVLIVVGAFSKSAQMPLHFWLPRAMTAPTPVSAYLHSATMVKAGVYLLARLNPVLGDSGLWHVLLTLTGAATMLVAAVMAAGQSDLKRILAYTTVSVLGTLTMLIGVGTDLAIKAAVVYLVAHACYKAALFMIAGSIEHATGTRDVRRLGGLGRAMPVTAASGLLAALSMAGAPPLFGFIGKELLLKAKLDLEYLGVVLALTAGLANVFLIAMALVVAVRPFLASRTVAAPDAHEAPPAMLAGPLVLAAAGLFVGLVPGVFDAALGSAMASAIGGRTIIMKLKLWHGLDPAALTALLISAVTLALGFAVFLRFRAGLSRLAGRFARLGRHGPARAYERLYGGLMDLAAAVTRATQNGSLRRYTRLVLLALVATCVYPLSRAVPLESVGPVEWGWHEAAVAILALVGAVTAVLSRSRLSAIAMVGITGILIAVLFALFSAPDLAITQIMVEALTVILLVLIFHRLPAFSHLRTTAARLGDAATAAAAGAVMSLMVLVAVAAPLPATVSAQMARLSVPQAKGRNVVNVILVDFRALDTLGETTVVAVAGLGVYALVKLSRRARGEGGKP